MKKQYKEKNRHIENKKKTYLVFGYSIREVN